MGLAVESTNIVRFRRPYRTRGWGSRVIWGSVLGAFSTVGDAAGTSCAGGFGGQAAASPLRISPPILLVDFVGVVMLWFLNSPPYPDDPASSF